MATNNQMVRADPRNHQPPVPVFEPAPALDKMPVRELVFSIARESQNICEKYVELAKLDLRQEVMDVRAAALRAGIAIGIGLVGAMLVGLAIAVWLASVAGWPPSLALVTVGGGALAIAGYLAWRAARLRYEVNVPDAVIEAKEDIEWVSEKT